MEAKKQITPAELRSIAEQAIAQAELTERLANFAGALSANMKLDDVRRKRLDRFLNEADITTGTTLRFANNLLRDTE